MDNAIIFFKDEVSVASETTTGLTKAEASKVEAIDPNTAIPIGRVICLQQLCPFGEGCPKVHIPISEGL